MEVLSSGTVEPICVKVGVTCGVIVIFIEDTIAHCDGLFGVKV